MDTTSFRDVCRRHAISWKASTPALSQGARRPGSYVDGRGQRPGRPVDYCLPREHSAENLLPGVRAPALALFEELGIPWHNSVDGGPSNHLLDSQVQCVNALLPLTTSPERIRRTLGVALDIREVLEVEPGRHLTFEYIGPDDVFGEGFPGRPRRRGTMCTSTDAAVLYRTSAGRCELALVEWKYTERYDQGRDPAKDATRRRRYHAAWSAPDSPLRTDVLPFEDLLVEPLYQLVRQQLLAAALEHRNDLGADVVRVVHVVPPENVAYQLSLPLDSHRAVGSTVDQVWRSLLRRPDRFVHLDPVVFTDPDLVDPEYLRRYAPGS